MKKRRAVLTAALAVLVLTCLAALRASPNRPDRPHTGAAPAEAISRDRLRGYLEFLAGDNLEGRLIGSRGIKIARDYIASLYRGWGIEPVKTPTGDGYFQTIFVNEFNEEQGWIDLAVSRGKERLSYRFQENQDYAFQVATFGPDEVQAAVVFGGFGLVGDDWNDLAGLNIRGRFVLLLDEEPAKVERLSKDPKMVERLDLRIRRLAKAGARGVLLAGMSDGPLYGVYRRQFGNPYAGSKMYDQDKRVWREIRSFASPELVAKGRGTPFLVVRVGRFLADALLGARDLDLESVRDRIIRGQKPVSFGIDNAVMSIRKTYSRIPFLDANVLGLVEGRDPELKNETIVVGAHLDHVEAYQNYVWNGANDNASGCAVVLELARAFGQSPIRSKRTLIFAHWTGEEKGGIGSHYFLESAVVPLDRIKLAVNLDCVGREVFEAEFGRNPQLFQAGGKVSWEEAKKMQLVWVPSKYPGFNDVVEEKAREAGLPITLQFVERIPLESDHAAFAARNIPYIYVNNGRDEDLHTPADTARKIDYEKLERTAQMLYLLVRAIAD